MDININPMIGINGIFYTIDKHIDGIIAHRCEEIVVINTITNNDVFTTVQYVAKGDDYKYENYEIYASFEAAEQALYGDEPQ